jgi:hypothetical protein
MGLFLALEIGCIQESENWSAPVPKFVFGLFGVSVLFN